MNISTEVNDDWIPQRRSRFRKILLASATVLLTALLAGGATLYWINEQSKNSVAPVAPVAPRAVNLPRMQLQAQYSGPLLHTLIQRWRDPNDGTICYIYLPIEAHHSLPTESGYVEYGANAIGSISCMQVAEKAPQKMPNLDTAR